MIKVRPGSDQKYVDRASVATPAYVAGIKNPRADWLQSTVAGKENYKTGVMQSIANDSFVKGATAAGSASWQNGALMKGQERYASGVQSAQDSYAKGIAPYLTVIEGITLPPRYPSGDPRNLERVKVIATKLREKKVKG